MAACNGLREAVATGDLEELAVASKVDDEVDLDPWAHDLMDAEDVRVVVEATHGVAQSAAPCWRPLNLLVARGWKADEEGMVHDEPKIFSHNRLPLNKKKK